MSTPSTVFGVDRDSLLMVVASVALLVVFLYSVLVVQQVLALVATLLWLFGVYLVWRFVRAHERLAEAAERIAADAGDSVETGNDRGVPADPLDSAEEEAVDEHEDAVGEPEGERE
ncbi:hypothetical protein [Salinigranum rubrum]|uniref:hypothetical protein n=1 Tax=Salinigranum rubrum TaxID=755307 RepID=UPI001C1F301F|nr:hypothetical protein [Salinigranum rubrum]